MDQLNAALGGGAANTLAQANAYTDQQIGNLRRLAFSGIAQAAALVPLAPASDGETTVNVGFASYGGYVAGGVAVARQVGSRVNINGGVGFSSGGQTLMRVGMGFRF
jgi:autotransporter adhesin